MSEIYAESNDEGAKALFYKRIRYMGRLFETGYSNLVNFNHGEKFLYGRVDRNYVPMVLNKTNGRLKKFNKTIAQERGLSALNFVVDAFKDMAQQFDKCASTGKIDTTDPFLSSLKVYKAYQNPTKLYQDHKKTYFDAIKSIFENEKIKVKNFDEFANNLMPILEKTAKRTPFTKPAFIKSRRCASNCSGLVIEIADLDVANDQEKIDRFINSNNWNFYLNACASYGFMVDYAIPWRLVADIGTYPAHSPMLDYAAQYGLSNTNEIIFNTYEHAHSDYYEFFKYDLLNLYNNVKLDNFIIYEECGDRMISKTFYPIRYTATSFFKKYSEQDLLKMYFKIRFFEEESQFTENEKSLMIDDCIETYTHYGLRSTLLVFEIILNKTFDYRGSLSYIVEQAEALLNEAIDKESMSQGY